MDNKKTITEKILRPVVTNWLQEKEYYVAHEVMLCGYCDVTGCKWAKRTGRRIPSMLEIVAVELKINDISGVLYQAITNCTVADFSYAALPLKKYKSMRVGSLQKFMEKGIGLLAVSNCVDIVIHARKNEISHDVDVCRRLWNFKIRHKGLTC